MSNNLLYMAKREVMDICSNAELALTSNKVNFLAKAANSGPGPDI